MRAPPRGGGRGPCHVPRKPCGQQLAPRCENREKVHRATHLRRIEFFEATRQVEPRDVTRRRGDLSLTVAARIEKLREAEPLLLEGYEGMKDHPDAPDERKREALERIVNLYEAWHAAEPDDEGDHGRDAHATKADTHATKAAEWRAKLNGMDPTTQPK